MLEAGVPVVAVGFAVAFGLDIVSRCRSSVSVSLPLVDINGDLRFEADLEGSIPETG
jgi:hypothetical protein